MRKTPSDYKIIQDRKDDETKKNPVRCPLPILTYTKNEYPKKRNRPSKKKSEFNNDLSRVHCINNKSSSVYVRVENDEAVEPHLPPTYDLGPNP